MKLKKCLSYDDVLLVPQYSDIVSRSQVDIGSDLSPDVRLEVPIISSPMDTVTEDCMASGMAKHGGLGIIHRYNTIEDQCSYVRSVKSGAHHVAAAIGVTGDYYDRAIELVSSGATILCIDVAHGHHKLMKKALNNLKLQFGDNVHLMAGNIATKEGFEDLARWGADSIRCNIGGGSICSPRLETGHGIPGFQTILDCYMADTDRDVKIIADGGIKNSGDIVKALAAGADFVMLGSLLAGTIESPGDIIYTKDGSKLKVYRGMASPEAQFDWRGKASSIEGVTATVPFRGSLDHVLGNLCQGIRSGLSYSGSRSIAELQGTAKFVLQTASGISESGTHIRNRSDG